MNQEIKNIQFPELPYAFDALEPHIDARTMELHYTKHHQGYFNNLKNAVAGTEAENMQLEDLFKNISSYSAAVRNNGGGHYNHSLFWNIMKADGGGLPSGILKDAIDRDLGGFEAFKTEFENAAKTRFGSGWAWLSVNEDGKLQVSSTPNQDNPLMDVADVKGTPVMGLDVWEHAYYLNYQNRRPDYVSAFWNVINWDEVSKNYEEVLSMI
jgi:Fe-Mn family superoxide dismutase